MERRQFTREFKLEAVRVIKERGELYAQASKDLGSQLGAESWRMTRSTHSLVTAR